MDGTQGRHGAPSPTSAITPTLWVMATKLCFVKGILLVARGHDWLRELVLMANRHKLGGLKEEENLPSPCRRPDVQTRVRGGLVPSRSSAGESNLCLSSVFPPGTCQQPLLP